MTEPRSWREHLKHIISNPTERARLANEIGIRPITLSRWVSGESIPRPYNVHQLLNALPKQQRDLLLASPDLEVELEENIPAQTSPLPDELPYSFIMQVLEARATILDTLRYWTIVRLVLQHALRRLDPERIGMAITVVQCMPPVEGKVRSLRESLGLGTAPWEGDLEQKAMFLGAESLAGYVVTTCREEAVHDLTKDTELLPAYQTEHEVSAIASPILCAHRIAGCLLISSTQVGYFLSEARRTLIHGYTQLLALAFEPTEFYPSDSIELRMMPDPSVQQKCFATFRQRVHKIMREHSLASAQAEQEAWRELEGELINYTSDRPKVISTSRTE